MYISTLQDFVRAMGGQLVFTVVFPEGEVQNDHFEKLREEKHPPAPSLLRLFISLPCWLFLASFVLMLRRQSLPDRTPYSLDPFVGIL
jgi:hypothetical protein